MGKSDHDLAQIIWDYMRYEQPLSEADIIIGLGSADVRTAEWCAKLYRDGFAPKILFTGGRGRITKDLFNQSEADVYEERALNLGVPNTAVLKESKAANTGENISLSYGCLIENGITAKKLLLVTKPYMLRRTYATFMKQWPGKHKPNIVMSAIDMTMDEYVHGAYIDFSEMTSVMVGDLQRIIEYPRLGFQIEQEVPDAVMVAYKELVGRGYTRHLLQDV